MEYVQALEMGGDYDRYKILLRRRLQESGWCDQIRLQAREIVKEKGPSITVDQLLEDLLPQGRASVPSAIKKELLLKVKEGLMKAAGVEDELPDVKALLVRPWANSTMESDRSGFCGCKGIRTCIKCEEHYNITKPPLMITQKVYTYCPICKFATLDDSSNHPNHSTDKIEFPGVYIKLDFISHEEENSLVQALDSIPWTASQSGRRKQNFGPKCNFKKRKLQLGDFNGFPESTRFVQDRFSTVDVLKDYQTIEQCSLEYDPNNGASIDPHIDDCWIWGERIVTVNLLSDSVLTLTPYRGENKRYNLELAPEQLKSTGSNLVDIEDLAVRVPMPRRSLLVLFGESRYAWEHMVLRHDITNRRICLAYREFTPPYLPGGCSQLKSAQVFEKAKVFW